MAAYKQNKWKNAYEVLKKRILDGTYPPGSEFPTNKTIGEEFDLHSVSVQSAVNELIREGLVNPPSNRTSRRTVRTQPRRSPRKGGFTTDSKGTKAHKELIEVKLIENPDELPEDVAKVMQVPVLFYHHNQYLEGTLVANSQSYIPGSLFPLDELTKRLNQKGARLYRTLEALGHKPTIVEEALISKIADENDNQLLGLPKDSKMAVAKIDRKVFDDKDNLVEYCKLTDRADVYIFEYRFSLH
jgi:GntR family transcriptional regulator